MKVSVIIPSYNASATILDSIRSVYSQELDPDITLEIIVVNDGSKDNTLRVLNDFIKSTHVENLIVINKPNGGVSSARNMGIRKASGDWIAFLDSDDVWLKNKLSRQLYTINQMPSINFLGSARNNEVLRILWRKIDTLYQASVIDLLLKMFPQTSTAIVRKSVLDEVGYYNESLTHSEDGELWVRLCNRGNFYYLPESLVITGGGKDNFGESGLSADLLKMHLGSLKILDYCLNNQLITKFEYFLLRCYYNIKYIRRKILVFLR